MKFKKAPELRFPEFQSEWHSFRFGEYVEERIEYPDGNLPLYSLTIENGIVPKTERYERSFLVKSDSNSYKLVRPLDFAFNPMNLRFGALALHKEQENVIVSKYYNIFYLNDNGVPRFFEYYLTTHKMIQFYEKMATGTLEEKKRVHYSDFINFKKPIPSKIEQQKIADFLTSVDQKIQHLRRKKELLEEYKKGVMQKLFPSADGQVPEIRFKDENQEDFPDWETRKLQEVADINPRGGDLPESFIYIDLESVEDGRLLKEEEVTVSEAPSRAQRLLEPGDILFQTVRPYQMNNYLFDKEGNYVASSGYAQIKASQNRDFLFHLLHYQPIVNLVIRWSTGSSFPAISATDLADLPLPFPSEKEQQKIADILNLLSSKIHTIESKIEKFQNFKKGLLQQMFV